MIMSKSATKWTCPNIWKAKDCYGVVKFGVVSSFLDHGSSSLHFTMGLDNIWSQSPPFNHLRLGKNHGSSATSWSFFQNYFLGGDQPFFERPLWEHEPHHRATPMTYAPLRIALVKVRLSNWRTSECYHWWYLFMMMIHSSFTIIFDDC